MTTTVYDNDALGNQLLLRSDDYNQGLCGGSCAVYSGTLNAKVLSYLGPQGGWRLGLYNQSARTLYVTPDVPYGTQPVGPQPGYYWQNVEAYALCYDQNNNVVPLVNVVSSSANCSMGLDFTSGGTKYKLVMSPSLPSATCPAGGCPVAGLATVSCGAVSSGQCVNWTIAPTPYVTKSSVANLYYYTHNGTLVFVGQYYNTYRIGVTNP